MIGPRYGALVGRDSAWLKLIDYRKTFSTGVYLWEQPGYLPDLELLARPEPHHSLKMPLIGEISAILSVFRLVTANRLN
jgi:hypothetical protein